VSGSPAANPLASPLASSDRAAHEHEREVRADQIRAVRLGHGANCSSVGSVIDTLFLASAVGGAIFAAVCAAMQDEPIRVVGRVPDADGDTSAREEET
jgi:hypothetical protein